MNLVEYIIMDRDPLSYNPFFMVILEDLKHVIIGKI